MTTSDDTAMRAKFLAVLAPTRREYRRWRRVERRMTAHDERALLADLQRVALTRPTVQMQSRQMRGDLVTFRLTAPALTAPGLTAPGLTAPGLTAAAFEVQLHNVSARAVNGIADAQLVGAGRYGRAWWISLDTVEGLQPILASHVTRRSGLHPGLLDGEPRRPVGSRCVPGV